MSRLAAEHGAITPATRMIVINSPNNPTATVFSGEDMRVLENLCQDRMSDEKDTDLTIRLTRERREAAGRLGCTGRLARS